MAAWFRTGLPGEALNMARWETRLGGQTGDESEPGGCSRAVSVFHNPWRQGLRSVRPPHSGLRRLQEAARQARSQADNQQTFAQSSLVTVKILSSLGCDCREALQKMAGSLRISG